jgi:hypothetical protein
MIARGYDFGGEARRVLERRRRREAARRLVRSRAAAEVDRAAMFAQMRRAFDERELDDRDTPYARVRDARRLGAL